MKGSYAMLVAAVSILAAAPAWAADNSAAALAAEAKISQADAEKTALAKVPDGKVQSAELEREHGHLIWSFDIARPKSKNVTEVNVDAISGKIVAWHVETPAKEAKEATAEKVEATGKPKTP